MSKRICLLYAILFTSFTIIAKAQTTFHNLKGLPTENIYNLYSDSKGFLWIAHSLGLSRFDGKFIKDFTSDNMLSLGVTDITEDNKYRIWYHNFIGQIFYVENEKVYNLTQYNYLKESKSPVLLRFKNEIVVTSNQGLFTCSIDNLHCRYLNTKAGNLICNSMSICNDSLIIMDNKNSFYVKDGDSIRPLAFINNSNEPFIPNKYDYLAPLHTRDTLIMYNNIESKLYVLQLKNKRIELVKQYKTKSFTNTVRMYQNRIWINSKLKSYNLNNTDTLPYKNISDVTTDRFGNVWYASLQNGVMYNNNEATWEETNLPLLKGDDFVRCIAKVDGVTVSGTQSGKIIITHSESGNKGSILQLPIQSGAVENLFTLPNNRVLIGTSIGLYYLNIYNQQINNLFYDNTLKTVSFNGNSMFLGYSQKMIKVNLTDELIHFLHNKLPYIANENIRLAALKERIVHHAQKIFSIRTNYVVTDTATQLTLAACAGDLYTIRNDSIHKLLFNNASISTQSLFFRKGQLFIGTINKGVLVYNHGFTSISTREGLRSNTILLIKAINDTAFLLEPDCIQVLNLNTHAITQTLPLPETISGSIYDLIIFNNKIQITTSRKIYSYRTFLHATAGSSMYLLSAQYSIDDAVKEMTTSIPHQYNSIQFKVGFPYFNLMDNINIQYRLKGANNDSWETIAYTDKPIIFYALSAGNYRFECRAVLNNKVISANTASYAFTILPPFWQQQWFYVVLIILLFALVMAVYRYSAAIARRANEKVITQIELEKKMIESSLTSIRAQMNPHFIFNALNTIQSYVYSSDKQSASNYLGRFSTLIRNILEYSQKDHITLSEEINFIKNYCELEKKKFNPTEIEVSVIVDPALFTDEIPIPPMILQPYIENAFKHGLFHKTGFKKLVITFTHGHEAGRAPYCSITIEDNGIGREKSMQINAQRKMHTSFSLTANNERVFLLNRIKKDSVRVIFHDLHNEKGEASGTKVEVQIIY
ncbi:MAG: histidine kinase [Bacteroidota bacterium]|nr:histidine kinase [Bacteroidota bacterium]